MHSGGKKMGFRNCFPGLSPPNNKGRREYPSRSPKAEGARRGVLPIWPPQKGQFTGGRTPTLAQKRRFVADLPVPKRHRYKPDAVQPKKHAQADRGSAGPPCAFWPIPPVAWVGKRRAIHGTFFDIWQFWRLRRPFNIEKGSLPPRMAPPGRPCLAHRWVRFRPHGSGRFWT